MILTNPNTGNKISLHDAVVENVDGVIALVENGVELCMMSLYLNRI
jgi:hypothetical protein